MMLTAVCLATSAGVPAVGAGAADRLSRSDGSPRRLSAEGTSAGLPPAGGTALQHLSALPAAGRGGGGGG